jgi:hypothetical protein
MMEAFKTAFKTIASILLSLSAIAIIVAVFTAFLAICGVFARLCYEPIRWGWHWVSWWLV